MKNIWTKLGAIAIAGVVVANAFIPYAKATDADPATNETLTGAAASSEPAKYFSVEKTELDFGRVSELDRSYTKAIEIRNNTENDVVIDATVEKTKNVNDEYSSLVEWLAFVGGATHFSVDKGESKSVNVRIAVPADAKAGSQYATVVLKDANGYEQKVNVKVDVAGDDLKYASEVVDAWVDPVRLDEKLNGRVKVKNTGTAGFSSTYQIKTKNVLGGGDWSVVKEVSEEVIPGGEVEFTAEDQLGFGIFSVEQRVTFVNNEGRMIESLLSRTVINLPWWSLAIAGGVLLFIILIIILAKRRKKNKKASGKMRKAEKKARKDDIERIEKAEEEAIANKKAEEEKKRAEEEAEADEIDAIAEQIEEAEPAEQEEADDYEESEAIPIKVTIKKSSKK